jgi:hypothetical protein
VPVLRIPPWLLAFTGGSPCGPIPAKKRYNLSLVDDRNEQKPNDTEAGDMARRDPDVVETNVEIHTPDGTCDALAEG